MKNDAEYYCSRKFNFLNANIERQTINACCTADSEKINLEWLRSNPGKLFNTPLLLEERQKMLDNIPVQSCAAACWNPEQRGLESRRMYHDSQQRTHLDINAVPEIVTIAVGTNCNMTCSYCCKEYSTAWIRDLESNGNYSANSDRFKLSSQDKIILKISQKEFKNSNNQQLILGEIKKVSPTAKSVSISGGEPFLYLFLEELVTDLTQEVIIWTGLGVDPKRFKNQLEKISHLPNLKIHVSAENIDNLYEFNRYGNSYKNFLVNVDILKSAGVNYEFYNTITNLTAFGLADFHSKFSDRAIGYSLCTEPDFLSINVLDEESKEIVKASATNLPDNIRDAIINNIDVPCTSSQKQLVSTYVKEFAARRNLSLEIFPKSFLNWINNVV